MPDSKRFSLVKPTIQTFYHIDFNWWRDQDRDWRVHLQSLLCVNHQKQFQDMGTEQMVDYIDPMTAEVQRVDGIQHVLISHCAKQPDFITTHTTLVDAVFRLFLSNGNVPLTPLDISNHLGRPAETILKTLSGIRVYKGLRPCPECK